MSVKAVLSLSGGIDSTTVLAHLLKHLGEPVQCVSFTYGSKHNRYENEAARKVAAYYAQPLLEIDLSVAMSVFKSNLLKSGGEIPEGHYNDASMSQTVVPARNIIFASLLAGVAESKEAPVVGLGIHQGDHAIYPDCRPGFFFAMKHAIQEGTDGKVTLLAPFLLHTKYDIIRWGLEEDVPYQLTRTCYKDQEVACRRCGSCVERREAFQLCGVIDPIKYEE
jgi:7-cyano-7-deazaguanine synthase